MPVYQLFVEQAIALEPRHVVMITPSRWFTGGLGWTSSARRCSPIGASSKMVDNPKLFDCFPGVEIKGGVSYFLWDREHDGDCEFSPAIDGESSGPPSTRDLRDGDGVSRPRQRAAADPRQGADAQASGA